MTAAVAPITRWLACSAVIWAAALPSWKPWSVPITGGAAASAQQGEAAPARQDARERARALFERGLEAYTQERLEQALELFSQAHALAPSGALLFNLARVHERMGDAANATARYREYLKGEGISPAERKRVKATIKKLERLAARQQAPTLRAAPDRSVLTAEGRRFFERARTLYRQGKYQAAHEAFVAARRFAPLPEVTYNLALVCEKLGRTADAVDHYRSYLRERPRAPDAAQVHERIRQLSAR